MSWSRPLGMITRGWWTHDELGWIEHLERVDAIAECPTCGADVECVAETDGGTEIVEGSRIFRADSWGPAMGECCNHLLADWWEGTFVFDFPERAP